MLGDLAQIVQVKTRCQYGHRSRGQAMAAHAGDLNLERGGKILMFDYRDIVRRRLNNLP